MPNLRADRQLDEAARRLRLEIIVAVVGGIAVPVIFSLVIPELPKRARLPLAIGLGAIFLIGVAVFLGRYLRQQFARSTRDVLEQFSGFRVDEKTGILLKGNIRNVSLRTETLHNMLNQIVTGIPATDRQRVLYEAGRAAGESWGRDFEREARQAGLDTSLERWSGYDAGAGMGRLEFHVDGAGCGSVDISNSFLSDERAVAPLNHWYAGYVAATLSRILDCNVEGILENPTGERERHTRLRLDASPDRNPDAGTGAEAG